jgi:hypothetical protein
MDEIRTSETSEQTDHITKCKILNGDRNLNSSLEKRRQLKATQVYSGGPIPGPLYACMRLFTVNTHPHQNSLKYGLTLTSLLVQIAHMASPPTIWIFSLSLGEGVTQISNLRHLS